MTLRLKRIGRLPPRPRLASSLGRPGTTSPVGPTLQALSLSSTTATIGQAFSATISGRTAGSTLSLSGAGAAGLSISGTTVSGTLTAAGSVDLVETLAGATNSPRTTSGAATVSAAATTVTLVNLLPNRQPQTVSSYTLSFVAGQAAGTQFQKLWRRTSGSTLSLSPNDGKVAISDDGTNAYLVIGGNAATAGVLTYTLTESHPRATNSGGALSASISVLVTEADNADSVAEAGFKLAAGFGRVHNASYAQGALGTRNTVAIRQGYPLGRTNYSSLRLGFSNFRIAPTSDQEEISNDQPRTISGAYAEIPGAPTPTVPITFGGQSSFTLGAGVRLHFCDALTPAMFGLSVFEDSTIIYYRNIINLASGEGFYCCGSTNPLTQVQWYDAANETNASEASGTGLFAARSGNARFPGFAPVMVVGLPASTIPCEFIMGDSITDRLSDTLDDGYAVRAAISAGIPFFKHTLGGRAAYMWQNNHCKSQVYWKFCNSMLLAEGTNDISNGYGAVLDANCLAIMADARSAGISYITRATTPPRVSVGTSGNALTTYRATDLANQFPYYTGAAGGLGYEQGGLKDQLNATIRGRTSGAPYANAVLDVAALSEDASSSAKWKVPTFSATLTADAAANAQTLSLSAAPNVGDCFVLSPGNSDIDPPSPDNHMYTALAVSGSGPYIVTIYQSFSGTPHPTAGHNFTRGRLLALPHTAGTVVRGTNAGDETHPTTPLHAAIAADLRAKYLARFPAYSFTNSEASAYVARMTTQPGDTRKGLIDTLFGSLKSSGVYTKLDAIWLPAAHDSQAATLNLKSASYTLTPTGSPTWTANKGYTGNGSSSYVATGFNPTTLAGSVGFVQDSAHIGAWVLTDTANTNWDVGSTNGRARLSSRTGTGTQGRIGTNTAAVVAVTGTANPPRHVIETRTGATSAAQYVNGAADGTSSTASNGLATGIELLREGGGTSFSDRQVGVAHIGTGLTGAEASALYNATRAYLQGVGVAT